MTDPILKMDPAELRHRFGVRFHHFHDLRGRLVATLVSVPVDRALVEVSVALVSKKEAQVSRAAGRQIALGRLLKGTNTAIPLEDLKAAIADRTVLRKYFDCRTKLRPRLPFVGDETRIRPTFDDHTLAWSGDDDLPF